MKTKLTIIVVLLLAVASCQQKPKSRIEERFEQYIQRNFVNPSDYKGIADIEHTDSFDFQSVSKDVLSIADSLNGILVVKMDSLSKSRAKSEYSSGLDGIIKDLEFQVLWMKYSNAIVNDSLRKDSIDAILKMYEPSMFVTQSYTLKVKIDGNTEITPYYALDCALIDSVYYSPSPIKKSVLPSPLLSLSGLIDRCLEDNNKRINLIAEIDKH